MRVVFIHPDLGIGGAERLVVDAAMALQESGHRVHLVTPHHDPDHAFPETTDGRLEVTVVADRWLPRALFGGRFIALCAYLRMIVATLWLIWFSDIDFDLIFMDQVSASIPAIKWFASYSKVLFYCHFPDQLLCDGGYRGVSIAGDGSAASTLKSIGSLIKSLYRWPLDWWEETTTGMADGILVNSKFTERIFRKTFTRLANIPVEVVYPSIQFTAFDRPPHGDLSDLSPLPSGVKTVFLSINRYERKKNLPLALHSLAALGQRGPAKNIRSYHLIMCGGYDERLQENVTHYEELVSLAQELDISNQVTFLKSPSDARKHLLLHSCTAVIYTPANEHFGIVPLEAMYMYKPVIAVSSGGPLETISDNETGFLVEGDPEKFAEAMEKFIKDRDLAREMGQAGRQRVVKLFSYETFKRDLNRTVTKLVPSDN